MALTGTILVGTWTAVLGTGTFLRIQAGGFQTISTRHNHVSNANDVQWPEVAFVWKGRPYIFGGSEVNNQRGVWTYDQNLDEMVLQQARLATARAIPFGEKVLFWAGSEQGYGLDSERNDSEPAASVACSPYNTAFLEDYLFTISQSQQTWWQAPFTGNPIQTTTPNSQCTGLCECAGDMYLLRSGASLGNPATLWKWNGVALFVQVGAGWTQTEVAQSLNFSSCVTFFKYGGDLFYSQNMYPPATRTVRIYSLNKATGAGTDITDTVIPAGHPWRNAAPVDGSFQRMILVRNDSGSSEQVFLIRAGQATPGWEACEFLGASTPMSVAPESTGPHRLFPTAGVYWDKDATDAEIRGAADSVPSSYVDMTIRTHDLQGNAVVDIDPRYKTGTDEPAPYNVMTEKTDVSSEGKTNLSTIPTGITTLADLSDDFSGASLDPNLWSILNIYRTTLRDWGFLPYGQTLSVFPWEQAGGEIRLRNTASGAAAGDGHAIVGKWFMNGAFQVDFTVSNVSNLTQNAAAIYSLAAFCKVCTNEGYGFRIHNNAGVIKVAGIYMTPNANWTITALSAAVVANGTVIRIARSGGNVWTITLDPAGVAEDITPAGANISEDVKIFGECYSTTAASPVNATPSPGFSDIDVSGAGSLGLYDDGVDHTFYWDHITDLGANIVAAASLFTDTE